MKPKFKQYIVYQALNKVNGKKYIGVTCNGLYARRRDHLAEAKSGRITCRVFHAAIRKYGPANFSWSILNVVQSFEEMMAKEIELIALLKPEYNICRGGRGAPGAMTGKTHNAKTRKRLRELGLARIDTFKEYQHLGPQSQMKKVVCLNTGKIYNSVGEASNDTGADKAAITELCLHYPRRLSANGLVFRYFGDHSNAKEEIEKVFKQKRNRWRSVICLTDGKEFESLVEAGKFYSLDKEVIAGSCRKGYFVSKDKLRFRYKDSAEVIRIADTPQGKQSRKENAARGCAAAKEAARVKREKLLSNA